MKQYAFLICAYCLLFFYSILLEAAPAKVEIAIKGIEGELLDNVRASLSLQQQQNNARLTSSAIEKLHLQAEQEIKKALQPFGYYRPTITAQLTAKDNEGKEWLADYQIDKGDAILIKKLDIQLLDDGFHDTAFKTIVNQFPLKEGDVLRHMNYEQGKAALFNYAIDHGYLDANYQRSEIQVDMVSYTATIILILDTAKRYRFGKVTFEQDTFNDNLLRTYLPFSEGEFYSTEKFVKFRNNLTDSGFFEKIEIEKQSSTNENQKDVPLKVTLQEIKRNRYQIRLGYGTDSQIRTKLDWERRYVNSLGHRFETSLYGVQKRREIQGKFEYFIPQGNPKEDYWGLGVNHHSYDMDYQALNLSAGGESRVSNTTFKASKYQYRYIFGLSLKEELSLQYLLESYNLIDTLFGNVDQSYRQEIIDALGYATDSLTPSYSMLIPRASWIYLEADDLLHTKNGQSLELTLQGSLDGFLSNVSFFQAAIKGRFIRGVFDNSGRVIVRGDFAYTSATSHDIYGQVIHQLPEALQFRTGGDRSVRGYGFEELKSKDSIFYGKHLLVGSLEYEHLVATNWGIAAFYDIGNAFNSFSNLDLKDSVGIGIRWYSPVGPVRLDVAHALADDATDSFRIHLNIGPDF